MIYIHFVTYIFDNTCIVFLKLKPNKKDPHKYEGNMWSDFGEVEKWGNKIHDHDLQRNHIRKYRL